MKGADNLFNAAERMRLDNALETGRQFDRARRRLIVTLASLPWVESSWRAGAVMRIVPVQRKWMALAGHWPKITLPFGWMAEKCEDRHVYYIGPVWYMLPRRWIREFRWWFYDTAIRYGAAAGPDSCLYSELEWFPKNPGST